MWGFAYIWMPPGFECCHHWRLTASLIPTKQNQNSPQEVLILISLSFIHVYNPIRDSASACKETWPQSPCTPDPRTTIQTSRAGKDLFPWRYDLGVLALQRGLLILSHNEQILICRCLFSTITESISCGLVWRHAAWNSRTGYLVYSRFALIVASLPMQLVFTKTQS